MTNLTDEIKEKPKGQKREFPIDFVIPLQLEECMYRIEHTSPSASLKLATRFSVYPIWHRNYTSANQFEAVFFTNGIMSARMQGYLHRWEGTSTRLMGDIEYSQADEQKLLQSLATKMILIFFATVLAVALFSPDMDPLFPVFLLWVEIIFFVVVYRRSQRDQSEHLANQIKVFLIMGHQPRGQQLPIDFVVPLPLEDCVDRIRNYRSNRMLKLSVSPKMQIENSIKFSAVLHHRSNRFHNQKPVLWATGTLQRWEETSTRFEGFGWSGEVYIPTVRLAWRLITLIFPFFICISLIYYDPYIRFMRIILWMVVYLLISWGLGKYSQYIQHHQLMDQIKNTVLFLTFKHHPSDLRTKVLNKFHEQ